MGITRRPQRKRRHRINPDASLSSTAIDSARVSLHVHHTLPNPRDERVELPCTRTGDHVQSHSNHPPQIQVPHNEGQSSDARDLPPQPPCSTPRFPSLPSTSTHPKTASSTQRTSLPQLNNDVDSDVRSDKHDDITEDELQGVAQVSDVNDIIDSFSTTMFFATAELNNMGDDTNEDLQSVSEPDASAESDDENASNVEPTVPQAPDTLTHLKSVDLLRVGLMIRRLSKKMSKSNLIAVITLYGQSRFSLVAYKHLTMVLREHQRLPSASTVRLRLLPYMIDNLTVKSTTPQFPNKSGIIGEVQRDNRPGDISTNSLSGNANKAVVVLPTEWARLDIRCLHSFQQLTCSTSCRCHPERGARDIRIERSDHVRDNLKCSGKSVSLWISKNGVPCQGFVGTVVKLHTYGDQTLPPTVCASSSIKFHKTTYKKEICNSFNATVLCTYVMQHTAENGTFMAQGIPPAPRGPNSSSILQTLTSLRQFIQQSPSPSSSTPVSPPQQQPDFKLMIGDHLTFLNATDDKTGSFIIVFVNRFWPSRLDDDREFLLFIPTETSTEIALPWIPSFGVPSFVSDSNGNQTNPDRDAQCLTTGILDSGQRYYMYRILLYADDFNARNALFPRGSVGGVYMSPAGFSVRNRRSQKTIRTVSLTPHGVSTNYVLDFVIDDLVSGSLEGFQCVDPWGHNAVCFFDIIGFLADYPASSAVVDVLGHNGSAPCTHCNFVLLRSLLRSRYSFSTIINSCNSMFRRTQWRTSSMRSANLNSKQAQQAGLKEGGLNVLQEKGRHPLLKLASRFNQHLKRLPRPGPFNSRSKDGYQMNIVAPDHLITGLMKGTLFCTFRQLQDDLIRDKLQILLKGCLLDFGFQSQTHFYQNKKLVPGLSMSMINAMFSVLPSLLKSLGQLDKIPTRNLIINLHSFVSLGFWWPAFQIDGQVPWDFVHGDNNNLYHATLHKLACNFVMSVDRYVRKYPALGRYVDRPNTHRLIELTTHTLPTYHHLLFVTEFIFESAHQPLKFLLSRNNTSNSHISSVHVILLKEWMYRVWCNWSIYSADNETDKRREAAMHTLMRLFCGHSFDNFNWTAAHLRDAKSTVKRHIVDVLTGTVGDILYEWYSDHSFDDESNGNWRVSLVCKEKSLTPLQRLILLPVADDLSAILNVNRSSFSYPSQVAFQRGLRSCTSSIHEKLRVGDIVQVLIRNPNSSGRFVDLSTDGSGCIAYLLIGGFIATNADRIWLITKQCNLTSGGTASSQMPDYNQALITPVKVPSFERSTVGDPQSHSILRLDSSVRKVGVLHDCEKDGDCTFSCTSRTVSHSRNTLEGGNFLLIPRFAGYPPRRS